MAGGMFMSSMCGIIDFEKKSVDFSVLRQMGRAMVLRGQDQSGAYLRGGIGLFHNRALGNEPECARQPHTAIRNGYAYTVMLDGELSESRDARGRFSCLDFESAAEAVLEAYLLHGLDFAPYVRGSFAFAICDEYRGEIILARSADGARPLYYTYENGRLVFASEIKGMLRAAEGAPQVDGMALRRHWLSAAGIGTGIYASISEVTAGTCLIASRIDCQERPLPMDAEAIWDDGADDVLIPSAEDAYPLGACLDEVLQAFDYPQFDAEMPTYCQALALARAKTARAVRILDGTRRESLAYARMREDRLGGFFGMRVCGVTPPEQKRAPRAWRALESALEERAEACDSRLLRRIYGDEFWDAVWGQKDKARRIRMLGMLCQTEPWIERYGVQIHNPFCKIRV